MAYEEKDWATGETIQEADLDRMEEGIKNNDTINALQQNDIEVLKSKMEETESTISSIHGKLQELESYNFEDMDSEIRQLKSDNNTIHEDIDTLQRGNQSLQTNLAAAEQQLNVLQESMEDLKEQTPSSYDLPAATKEALGGIKMAEPVSDVGAVPTEVDINTMYTQIGSIGDTLNQLLLSLRNAGVLQT